MRVSSHQNHAYISLPCKDVRKYNLFLMLRKIKLNFDSLILSTWEDKVDVYVHILLMTVVVLYFLWICKFCCCVFLDPLHVLASLRIKLSTYNLLPSLSNNAFLFAKCHNNDRFFLLLSSFYFILFYFKIFAL